MQSLEVGRIVPIYESAANTKLTSRWFRRIIYGALENLGAEIPDGVPPALCRRLQLLDRRTAFAAGRTSRLKARPLPHLQSLLHAGTPPSDL